MLHPQRLCYTFIFTAHTAHTSPPATLAARCSSNALPQLRRVPRACAQQSQGKRVVKGETAKGGDNGLALQKANPKFGSVGHNTSVEFPLPGCLDTLLNKSILKRAKSDNLAKTLKRIKNEPEVQAVMARNKP